MLELRNLFSLMLASTRKYLDPTRAVELLKGNIGNKSSNGNGNSVTTSENIQQDVSEFTHIFLDWLEEAFKSQHDSSATTDSEAKDESMEQEGAGVGDNNAPEASESENNSGHEDSENVDPNRQSHRSSHGNGTWPFFC